MRRWLGVSALSCSLLSIACAQQQPPAQDRELNKNQRLDVYEDVPADSADPLFNTGFGLTCQ